MHKIICLCGVPLGGVYLISLPAATNCNHQKEKNVNENRRRKFIANATNLREPRYVLAS